mmetsp:Transcript_2674/g.8924  ORF Transcript_2674/g.8924 Transcript_2674/m.8924 type:complete len:277 (-) Transcript_2674:2062-2892(-)
MCCRPTRHHACCWRSTGYGARRRRATRPSSTRLPTSDRPPSGPCRSRRRRLRCWPTRSFGPRLRRRARRPLRRCRSACGMRRLCRRGRASTRPPSSCSGSRCAGWHKRSAARPARPARALGRSGRIGVGRARQGFRDRCSARSAWWPRSKHMLASVLSAGRGWRRRHSSRWRRRCCRRCLRSRPSSCLRIMSGKARARSSWRRRESSSRSCLITPMRAPSTGHTQRVPSRSSPSARRKGAPSPSGARSRFCRLPRASRRFAPPWMPRWVLRRLRSR